MPYVATGRMWMATSVAGQYNSVCSASLIGKGLVVTAAHCIQEYGLGTSGTVKSARFIPGNNGNNLSSGPHGGWDVKYIVQPPSYKNGTDTCSTSGVVCNNDLAVLVLEKNGSGQYPYSIPQISYYGYGSNGYGFVTQAGTSGQGNGQITQLGYPCGLDNCQLMQRNDSIGLLTGSGSGSSPKQITIGSQMTGGSSGGPWIINFGTPSVLGSAASSGRAPLKNIVQATTSWGYTNNQIQVQGASPFGQNSQYPSATPWKADGVNYGVGNIGALVYDACRTNGAVKGKTLGACW
jgi:V8-like Glu-specific endopeptidase